MLAAVGVWFLKRAKHHCDKRRNKRRREREEVGQTSDTPTATSGNEISSPEEENDEVSTFFDMLESSFQTYVDRRRMLNPHQTSAMV